MSDFGKETHLKKVIGLVDKVGMLLVLGILFACCAIFVKTFFTPYNMMIALPAAIAPTGIVACSMLFCLASGDFDLSVGSIYACAGVVATLVMRDTGSLFYGIAAGLAGGMFIGWLNGVIVAKFKINALITTLAGMQIVRGLAYILSKNQSIGVADERFLLIYKWAPLGFLMPTNVETIETMSPWLKWFLRMPVAIWVTGACFLFFGLLLRNTIFGRNTLAIGGNEEAAKLAGIPVDRMKIAIFAIQGFIAAMAGIIIASKTQIGDPKLGMGFELQVISACVLGGVSLSGGVGSMVFVVTGVLIMGIIENAMNILNIDSNYQLIVSGGILLAAVLFDRFKNDPKGFMKAFSLASILRLVRVFK